MVKIKGLCLISIFFMKYEVMLSAGGEGRGGMKIAILGSGREAPGEKKNRLAGGMEFPLEA